MYYTYAKILMIQLEEVCSEGSLTQIWTFSE